MDEKWFNWQFNTRLICTTCLSHSQVINSQKLLVNYVNIGVLHPIISYVLYWICHEIKFIALMIFMISSHNILPITQISGFISVCLLDNIRDLYFSWPFGKFEDFHKNIPCKLQVLMIVSQLVNKSLFTLVYWKEGLNFKYIEGC